MPDIGDMGKQYSDHAEKMAVDEIRARLPVGESAIECEDCGDYIPEARRLAYPGCTRCVECLEAVERRQ